MLCLCAALWAVSFPTMKALPLLQPSLVPAGSSWFFASLCVTYRFGLSGAILCVLLRRSMGHLTGSELRQGLGVGLFGGAGILLQMDGLSHTLASTSAFLTQCYCLLLPLWVSLTERRRPSRAVVLSCLLVMIGVAVLSDVDWSALRMGRGEVETLFATAMFAGQILWLQRPCYEGNDAMRISAVSFLVTALSCLPVAVATAPGPLDFLTAYASPAAVGFLAILVGLCTLGGYVLMNRWQRHVPAVQAGLIYCLEPVFASGCAIVMPAWLSFWAGVPYENETVGVPMLVGGGLIIAANVIIQAMPPAGKTGS
jgi:drug/metabolite transporter (DMT)-like permease